MEHRVNYNGYVVICENHNKGAIINLTFTHDEELEDALDYGNKVIEKHNKSISKKMCCKLNCEVFLDGLSLNNRIVVGHHEKYYNVFYEGWKLEDFYKKNNIHKMSKIVSVCI